METLGVAAGGEIFAKTAKTPPLQSGVARMPLRSKCRPIAPFTMPIPSAPHTASHEPRGFYNDAARRVVILPFAVSHLCPSGRK